ncbi:MAG: ATP-binding protein [Myxococcales bacterium]|nr:ATP-binding protein [Myxococcales bacterium]
MSEPLSEPFASVSGVFDAGFRPVRAVARIGGRLAGLLEQGPRQDQPIVQSAVVFLRAMEEAVVQSWPMTPSEPPPELPTTFPDPLQPLAHSFRPDATPIERLIMGFGLDAVDLDILWTACLPDCHEGYASVLRALSPRGEPQPTVGLLLQLLAPDLIHRPALEHRLTGGALRRAGLILLGEEGPLPERAISLQPGLWNALTGLAPWPTDIELADVHPIMSGLEHWATSPDVLLTRRVVETLEPVTVVVSAEDEATALHRAAVIAQLAGRPYITVRLAATTTPGVWRRLALFAVVSGRIPVVGMVWPDGPKVSDGPDMSMFPIPVLLAVREGAPAVAGDRAWLHTPIGRLSVADRVRMWEGVLPELTEFAPGFAVRYRLEPDLAFAVARSAKIHARMAQRPVSKEDVGHCVRARLNVSLPSGVALIRPTAGFGSLVLAEDRVQQLREAIDRLNHQPLVLDDWRFLHNRSGARGVRMLFSGPPGTGKTLAAEVMAHELDLDVLLVDVSKVVSKWIGETEKNLGQVFDAAERTAAVLFFDEADSLFGRRTEVSDAHDRYANLETAYLLSRLERFEGLAVLSTNLRQNIDNAFLRRLEFVVDFDEPEFEDRVRLWRAHVPQTAPVHEEVDFEELALMYPIVGGLIRNAATAAAFLAASHGSSLGRHHFFWAIWREYEKAGRAFPGFPAGVEFTRSMFGVETRQGFTP